MRENTLGDIEHTHPATDEPFGTSQVYRRGPLVIADGGRTEQPPDTLGSIDHTGPFDQQRSHNRVFDRGGEP